MLRIVDKTRYPSPLDDWPLPLEVPFMDSRELAWLKQDLGRYAGGRVRGRSYLIAGHRGAGKTALVQRAAELLASSIMRETVKENGELADGPIERPLIVKLHGPSMLDPQLAEPAPTGATATPEALAATPDLAPKQEPGQASSKDDDKSGAVIITPGPHAALVQITIGLYRALAAEATTGFRAHARLAARQHQADQGELATQLALDLDGGAAPVRLRFYWGALGRLAHGVLWPRSADNTLDGHGMSDQGLREIIALSTAAQAFQVCTGRLSYSEGVKEQVVRKEVAELKGSSDIKDALARLGTLGIGALTGVSILGSGAGRGGALAGGLAVWFLGSLSLTWSRNRTRTNDRSVDYSFIRDSTLATLGRDLPVVISRVRDAGLAPVFVIDELDKVREAPAALAALIGKLKHLIADFGFFCFLVNRDCYEEIESRIHASAYPPEHTLFSDRLLLRPDPVYMLRYLSELIEIDPSDAQAGLARVTFCLGLIHEARLNLTDLMRLLSRAAQPGTRDISDSTVLTSQRRLVIATVQIAINEVLRAPRMAERINANPSFAQLAVDTLYYPSRLWGDGVLEVDPSPETLRSYLQARRGSTPGVAAEDHDGGLGKVGDEDLELLQGHLVRLLTSLGDLNGLRTNLGERNASGIAGATQPGDARLADVPPRDVERLCEPLPDGRFRFRFSRDGDPIVSEPGRLAPAQRHDAEAALAYAEAFLDLVAAVHVDVDQLARTPLIVSINKAGLAQAIASVTTALRRGNYDSEVEQHLSTLARLRREVGEQADKLARLFLITSSLARDVEDATSILPAITRLIHFERDPEDWMRGLTIAASHPLSTDANGLRRWTEDHLRWLLPAPGSSGLDPTPDYPTLAEQLQGALTQTRPDGDLTPDYPMLIQAVRRRLPAAALAWNPASMTAGDWSRLALSSVPTHSRPALAPYWLFVAALRGLGFGREALEELSAPDIASELAATGNFRWVLQSEGMTPEQCLTLARTFAVNAPERPAGLLVVEQEGERFGGDTPTARRPVLIVDAKELGDYRPVLNWLSANGILGGQSAGPTDGAEVVL